MAAPFGVQSRPVQLQLIDWIIAAIALIICFAPALFVGGRARKDTTEFFASGRSMVTVVT